MRLRKYLLSLTLLLVCCAIAARKGYAQDTHVFQVHLQEYMMLDIENGSAIALAIVPPTEAGNSLDGGAASINNTSWVNYTCALASASPSRNVSVRISSGSLPSGVGLRVTAGTCSTGAGTRGTPVSGGVLVSTIAQNIITGIRGSYTGNGTSNGHNITYALEITNYDVMAVVTSQPVALTYTISSN